MTFRKESRFWRKYLLIMAIISVAGNISARFVPSVNTIDFGTIKEEDGKQTHRVYLTNTGNTPDFIMSVRTGCGCTATKYYEDTVAPGDSAWIDITYNPTGRIGKFDKTVKIYDQDNEKTEIGITGNVVSTPETIKSLYPVEAGPLYLTEKTVMIPKLRKGDSKFVFINAFNISSDNVTPVITGEYDGIETVIEPKTISPGEIGTIGIYINTRKMENNGQNTFLFDLYPAEGEVPVPVQIILPPFEE